MILRMLHHHYEPTLPLTPPTTSHHRRCRQGPLHSNRRSRHRRRRPPSPPPPPPPSLPSSPSSPSRGWLLLGAAWFHHHPHHCPPPPPQPRQQRLPRHLTLSSSPPVFLPPPSPSRPQHPLNCLWRCNGPACGVDTLPVRRVECRYRPRPTCWGEGPLRQRRRHGRRNALVPLRRSAVDPTLLLGPPPVGRWRRQHSNIDGRPCQPGAVTTTPWGRRPTVMVISVVRWDCWSAVWVGCGCVCRMLSWSVLWCGVFRWLCVLRGMCSVMCYVCSLYQIT